MFHAMNQSPYSTPPVVEAETWKSQKKNTMDRRKIAVAAVFVSLTTLFVYSAYPQVHARVKRFFWQGNQLHNLGRMITSVIFDNPEEFKPVFDLVWHALDEFTAFSNDDDETVRQARRTAKLHVAFYEDFKFSTEGNATKAEEVIQSIRFSSYKENNVCYLKDGIPEDKFDATVDEIEGLTKMPIAVKNSIKNAKNATRGAVALQDLQFTTKDGNMVFGRVVVLPVNGTIDVAISLHSLTYKLREKQNKPECAVCFGMFSETLNETNDVDDKSDEDDDDPNGDIFIQIRKDFLAFFYKQAIEGFRKQCDILLKVMDNGQEEEL